MDNTKVIVEKIIKSEKKRLLYLWIYTNNMDETIKIIDEYADGQKYDVDEIIDQFQVAYSQCPDIIKANLEAKELFEEAKQSPACPTCGSTNLKKISTTAKAMNTAFFGLVGTKRYKTFHCNNCGYEW